MKERVWHTMVLWDKTEIRITPEQRKVFEPAWEQGDTIIRVGDDHAIMSSAIARFAVTGEPLPEKLLPAPIRLQLEEARKAQAAAEPTDEQRKRNSAKLREMRENVTRYGKANPTPEDKEKAHRREQLSKEMNAELRAAKTPKQREAIIKKYQAKIKDGVRPATGVRGVRAQEKTALRPKPDEPGENE